MTRRIALLMTAGFVFALNACEAKDGKNHIEVDQSPRTLELGELKAQLTLPPGWTSRAMTPTAFLIHSPGNMGPVIDVGSEAAARMVERCEANHGEVTKGTTGKLVTVGCEAKGASVFGAVLEDEHGRVSCSANAEPGKVDAAAEICRTLKRL